MTTFKTGTKMEETIAETAAGVALPAPPSNIHQRISAIQAGVTRVEKSAKVAGQYMAVTHDDVTKMLRPLMIEHGVVSAIHCRESAFVETGVNAKNGRPLRQLQATYWVVYYNVDNPEDSIGMEVLAHADDGGDKSPGKAISYAQKYADLKTFRITTGEDDEQRVDPEKYSEPKLTHQHFLDLWATSDALFGDDSEEVLNSMAKNVFQVETPADILDKHISVAINKLSKKAEDEKAD